MSDGTDIDFLHGIVRYILGNLTDEGKAVMKAADRIERLEAERDDYKDRWEQTGCTRHSAMEASIRLNEGYRKKIERLEAALQSIIGQTDDQFVDGVWREVNTTAREALDSKEQT